jgi:hypothetical protein
MSSRSIADTNLEPVPVNHRYFRRRTLAARLGKYSTCAAPRREDLGASPTVFVGPGNTEARMCWFVNGALRRPPSIEP